MDIYKEILDAVRGDGRVTIATIISTSGSTPVPPGAKMLVREGGAIPLGTVGGGCVEADVLEAARKPLDGKGMIRRFTLTEDDIESGMVCGGTVDILIERVSVEGSDVYGQILKRREAGKDSAVVTMIDAELKSGGKFLVSREMTGINRDDMSALRRASHDVPVSLEETLLRSISREAVTRLPWADGELIIEPVIGFQDLIIFGGGHVSRYVSRAAAMAGFRVTVVDDRPEYANTRRFPDASQTLALWFDDSWAQLQVRDTTSIVIVTRGHKFDEMVLERAVETPARYVGMIGSKRKVLTTFANLIARGISVERLRSVRAPIGLDIGALTAEEIGISIVAELIAVRRGAQLPARAMSDGVAEFFAKHSSAPKHQ